MHFFANMTSIRLGRSARPAGPIGMGLARLSTAVLLAAMTFGSGVEAASASETMEERFDAAIQPILEEYCSSCHANGIKKGGVDFDGLDSERARLRDRDLWWGVLRNVRSGIMPPPGKPRPSEEERQALEDWIKYGAFAIDPKDPDPGRVTVRRLNRVEYRNTIRDLIGVEYDTTAEFPTDDSGHGFDNIGDVLTLSPLLLEKYLAAANTIVSQAVPMVPKVAPERVVPGGNFRRADGGKAGGGPAAVSFQSGAVPAAVGTERLSVELVPSCP